MKSIEELMEDLERQAERAPAYLKMLKEHEEERACENDKKGT